MISISRTNIRSNAMPGTTKRSTKSRPAGLNRNQVTALAAAFGLAAFTVVLLSAVWSYVMVHGM